MSRRDPAITAALDQWDAEGRDLCNRLQAYIDKLDRQIAWHARWDKWILRAIIPGGMLLSCAVLIGIGWLVSR